MLVIAKARALGHLGRSRPLVQQAYRLLHALHIERFQKGLPRNLLKAAA